MFKQILLNLSNNTKFLLHSLPYNEAFLREVMRKQTIVPLAIFHSATEDTELNGYFIPKVSSAINLSKTHTMIRDALVIFQQWVLLMQDTAVFVNLWSFHNDPNFWGDPEVFRPERFLDERGHLLKKDYSLPFGAGQWCQFLPLAFWVLTLPTPNITVKCITFLLCISRVADSSLHLNSNYSEVFRTSPDALGMIKYYLGH